MQFISSERALLRIYKLHKCVGCSGPPTVATVWIIASTFCEAQSDSLKFFCAARLKVCIERQCIS
jgi:hypothetical protein